MLTLIILLCSLSQNVLSAQKNASFELLYGFKWLDFNFSTPEEHNEYINNKFYQNCMPAGVKINSKGRVFISIPRWNDHVPATFVEIVKTNSTPILNAWPSWEANKVGNKDALQSVLGFEVDLEDNIWILDQGKVNNSPAINGSLKLQKYSSDGVLLKAYDLSSVADPYSSFLNDLVIDTKHGYIYIADSGINLDPTKAWKPTIIVLNIIDGKARRVLDSDYSVMPDPSFWLTVNGEHVTKESPMRTGVDGIALSCDFETLYYTPLSSRMIYSISTSDLIDPKKNLTIDDVFEGFKLSASDAILASKNGHLYMTAIEKDSIYIAKSLDPTLQQMNFNDFDVLQGNNTFLWPDTMAFDPKGNLVFVSNQLNYFIQKQIDFDNPKYGDYNFRIWKVAVDDGSYLLGCQSKSSGGLGYWLFAIVGGLALVTLVVAFCMFRSCYKKRGEYNLVN